MAFIDPEKQCLTVRIVFDGAPEAGKTATLEALARSVGENVLTPEERDRRTLYFDWMEHTAGRFGGRPINCQIVTVPGQRSLFDRRESILQTADAVVFVVDSRASELARGAEALNECRSVLMSQPEPCELLVQANKQDCEGALSPEAVVSGLGATGTLCVGSIADQGVSVREVFLQAVRLALARVRRLDAAGALVHEAIPNLATAQALYNGMGRNGAEPEWSETVSKVGSKLSPFAKLYGLTSASAPLEQDPIDSIGEGLIWPPVEGRILIKQAQLDDVQWDLSADELHSGRGRAWFFAACGRPLNSVEKAKALLLRYAREHVKYRPVLSSERCLAVLSSDNRHWQLWQIVKRRTSLRDLIERSSWSGVSAEVVAQTLRESVLQATEGLRAIKRHGNSIRTDLRQLGAEASEPPLVGLFEFAPPGLSPGSAVAGELTDWCEEVRSSFSTPAFEAIVGDCWCSLEELEALE